jgi:hypothetical protein
MPDHALPPIRSRCVTHPTAGEPLSASGRASGWAHGPRCGATPIWRGRAAVRLDTEFTPGTTWALVFAILIASVG